MKTILSKFITAFSALLIFSSVNLFSQEDAEWYTYFPQTEIHDIALEGNFVWVATSKGITKINKITGLKTFFNISNSGLPVNLVNCITIDESGDKWIGTDDGMVKYDGTSWTVYNTSNSDLPNDLIECITIDGNSDKWIGTVDGFVKFDGSVWTIYNTTNSGLTIDWVTSISIDGNSNKWIGTVGGGVAKFDGTNWTVYNTSNSGLPNNYINCISIDSNGDVWIGTIYDGGLAKYDGTNWTVFNKSNSGLTNNYINSISIDSNDDKWIGTDGGMVKYDGTTWTIHNTSNSGLINNYVNCIEEDDNGDKWIGTGYSGGMVKFDGTNWTVYNTSNSGLTNEYITCIVIDGYKNKWIGTENGGIAKFDGANWSVYNTSNSGLPNNSINCLALDGNGDKWIGTDGGGMSKFDGINWTIYNTSNSELPDNYVNCITIDGNGIKWVGTGSYLVSNGGIAKFDGADWTVYNTSNSKLPYNYVSCITVDGNGDKWIGTYRRGLAKFVDTIWTVYDTTNSDLPEDKIQCITIDIYGNKWIGTGDPDFYPSGYGMVKFDGIKWTIYHQDNSRIDNNYVKCITIDNNEYKWIGTFSLTKFDGTNWTIYNTSNSGLPGGISCITIDSNDDKWIGTNNGLAYYSPKIFTENIEGVYCAGENINISYTTKQKFNPDNVFTAQLSDSTGMFYNNAVPVVMGMDSAREGGTINITIPKDTPFGTKYRIRVSASSPFARGVDNGRDLTIYPSPKPEIINFVDSVVLPGTVVDYETNNSISYLWRAEGGTLETDSTLPTVRIKWGVQGFGKLTLIQTNEFGCVDSVVKTIKIQSADLPTNVVIVVDSTVIGKPGDFVQIPIYLINSDSLNQYSVSGFTADLKYNASMLLPVDENKGSIVDGERIISLDLPRYPDFNKILTALNFKVDLGNSISTILKLDNLKTVGDSVELAKRDGKFTLEGYCIEGGYPRLISNNGMVGLILLSPNPSTESFELEYELIEKGSTKIYICNAFGEVVKTILESETVKTGKDKMTISTSDLPTGMYFVILQTPTIRRAEKLEIIK